MFLTFILAINQVNAKSIYYVKAGATGDGSSWSNASGDIQGMIDKASSGDEVWIAGGTYYPLKEAYPQYFKIESGVSLYGGFAGNEKSISERSRKDRDKNGKIEPWEFQNETVLRTVDEDRILHLEDIEYRNTLIISGITFQGDSPQSEKTAIYSYIFEDISSNISIVNCAFHDNKTAINISCDYEVVIDGCSIFNNKEMLRFDGDGKKYIRNTKMANNRSGIRCYLSSSLNTIENCEIIDNNFEEFAIDVDTLCECTISGNTITKSDYITVNHLMQNCSFTRNIGCGVEVNGKVMNCDISDNNNEKGYPALSGYSLVYNCSIKGNSSIGATGRFYNCTITDNGGLGASGSLYNCIVANNKEGGCSGNIYDSEIYDNYNVNSGGGISGGTATNCKIYNNESLTSGGGISGTAYNCLIYGNKSGEDGGGINGYAYHCSIFNNQADGKGGGAAGGSYYNCDIYNNQASSYGGIYSSSVYSSTIIHNKSLSGIDNAGWVYNQL